MIEDSRTYTPIANLTGITGATVQAADQQRPYLRLASDWVLDTGANQESTLTLEGLWIGAGGAFAVIVRGDYERVVVSHSTLDPGGTDAQGNPLRAVALVVEGNVEELLVENSILSSILVRAGGLLETLKVRDSILHAPPGALALPLPATYVELERVTVFGGLDVNRLYATEALISGPADVTNTQDGCFRFSAAPPGSRVPHPYESHFLADTGHFFTSRRFGDPGYAQLSQSAPLALARGAENGSEIGAFSSLLNPVKLDSLRAKIDEFAPFGLVPIYIFET